MVTQINTKTLMNYRGLFNRPKELKLGAKYVVSMFGNRVMHCQLIQPTPKGYNFLNLQTHKCILKHHIYPSKLFPNQLVFFLLKFIMVTELPDFSEKTA